MSHLSSASLCRRSTSPGFHIFSLFISSFVFILFFLQTRVIWQFRVVFSSPPHKHSYVISLPPVPPRRPRREREEICFCHMLIYSELPAEAERYLFPRSCRESDGNCYCVFISSTQSDELLHPRRETFSDTLLSKHNKKHGVRLGCSWVRERRPFSKWKIRFVKKKQSTKIHFTYDEKG